VTYSALVKGEPMGELPVDLVVPESKAVEPVASSPSMFSTMDFTLEPVAPSSHPAIIAPFTSERSAVIPFMFATHRIRVIILDGKLWWVAMDVCEALGYADPDQAIRKNCKHAKLFKSVSGTGLDFGPRGVLIIPESDLYRLIMRSKLPEADKFQDWVVEVVLPQIRQTGLYATPATVDKILADPNILIQVLTQMKVDQEKLLATIEEQRKKNDATARNTATPRMEDAQ
jgi:prophage antirepressor-like protein